MFKNLFIGLGQVIAELVAAVHLISIQCVIAAAQLADAMLGDVVQCRGGDVVIQHMLIVVELHDLAGDGAVAHAVGHMGGLQVVRFKLQHFAVARFEQQRVVMLHRTLQLE